VADATQCPRRLRGMRMRCLLVHRYYQWEVVGGRRQVRKSGNCGRQKDHIQALEERYSTE
jgi:hypothetical protein